MSRQNFLPAFPITDLGVNAIFSCGFRQPGGGARQLSGGAGLPVVSTIRILAASWRRSAVARRSAASGDAELMMFDLAARSMETS